MSGSIPLRERTYRYAWRTSWYAAHVGALCKTKPRTDFQVCINGLPSAKTRTFWSNSGGTSWYPLQDIYKRTGITGLVPVETVERWKSTTLTGPALCGKKFTNGSPRNPVLGSSLRPRNTGKYGTRELRKALAGVFTSFSKKTNQYFTTMRPGPKLLTMSAMGRLAAPRPTQMCYGFPR
jgi:hypothetical protein